MLDVVVVVAAVAAAIGGWRFGFVARLLAWAGVAVGLMIGIRFVPGVVTAFGGTAADDRVTVALLFLVLVATLGQGIGLAVGAMLHRVRPEVRGLPRWDRVAGALVGVAGVFVLVWMTIPSLATAEGWPARVARGSFVVHAIDDVAPEQPGRFAAWGRRISEAPYPTALGPLEDPPDPGPPPRAVLPRHIDRDVRPSVVKVSGRCTDQFQEGSGFVVDDHLVATNAHVVAGEDSTTVYDNDDRPHQAEVVAFDPTRDIAILHAPTLEARPLELVMGEEGDLTAVYGHPGGGALRAAPARLGERFTAVGTDIYRTGESSRQVFVLGAALQPGDSGAPVVDGDGGVVGVAFAIDPAQSATAYAMTVQEIRPVLEAAGDEPVSTGVCL
jgi:S1-C subfamily serine protease